MNRWIMWLAACLLAGTAVFSLWKIRAILSDYRQGESVYQDAQNRFVTTLYPEDRKDTGHSIQIGDFFAVFDPENMEEPTEDTAWMREAASLYGSLHEAQDADEGADPESTGAPADANTPVASDKDGSEEAAGEMPAAPEGNVSGETTGEMPAVSEENVSGETDRKTPAEERDQGKEPEGEEYPAARSAPVAVDWAALSAVNPDIAGWIFIEALPQVSYPVLQGADDEYYVYRTYDRQASSSGCIFISSLCSRDLSSPHTLVYGHNMNNGTMFSPLYTHRGDGTFEKDPYIWFLTPGGDYCYRVFSIFETVRTSEAFTVFYRRDEAFLEHAYGLLARGSFYRDESVSLNKESRIITLISCVPSTYNRTAVCAVCISEPKPGERVDGN